MVMLHSSLSTLSVLCVSTSSGASEQRRLFTDEKPLERHSRRQEFQRHHSLHGVILVGTHQACAKRRDDLSPRLIRVCILVDGIYAILTLLSESTGAVLFGELGSNRS